MGASAGALLKELKAPLHTSPHSTALSAGLLGAMAAPHILYACIWYRPEGFRAAVRRAPLRLLGSDAVEVFNVLCLGLKSLQVAALGAWCELALLPGVDAVPAGAGLACVRAARSLPETRLGLAGALFGVGQALNIGIYAQIGKAGVYYGFKLGQPVPWATGFPFNLGFRHPQYVGAMLAWTGILSLAAVSKQAAVPLAALLGVWASFYSITAQIEERGDPN